MNMTKNEELETVGRCVNEYTENHRKIAILTYILRGYGDQMKVVGKSLREIGMSMATTVDVTNFPSASEIESKLKERTELRNRQTQCVALLKAFGIPTHFV